MTTEVTTCPRCNQEALPGERYCTRCGQALSERGTWPTWVNPEPELTPQEEPTDVAEVEIERVDPLWAPKGEPDFVPLPVDPTPAERSWLGPRLAKLVGPLALLALIVLWIVAERMLVTDHSWAHWDIVWYLAAGLTLLGSGAFATVLWMRAREGGGWRQAITWLFS